MADDTWRYAEPDGKQRALTLDDLQRSLSRGLLPTNVPVWHAGFADWTPASDVPELRASVASGARIIPAKGSPRPGRPVAQRGGAAAQGEEPMSPPSYSPARKARPAAPALDLNKPAAAADKPGAEEPMRSRASTLLIAGGAPGLDRNPESEATPINVPTPGGANEAPNTITRPPPVSDGGVVVPNIPPSSGKITSAGVVAEKATEVDDQAETKEMPAAQRATLRDEAWDIPDEPPMSSGRVLDVSSSMLLPDSAASGSVPQVVSTSMLLPNDNSSGTLPDSSDKSPDSTEEIPDSEVISAREPEVKRPTMPPPLQRSSRPSHPGVISPSLRPSSSPGFPRPSRPSFPSRSEVESHTPPPNATSDVAERIGLKSKPPPPDINPLSSDFPPPPGIPAEARDDEKTDPSMRKKREAERKSAAPAPEQKAGVPLWGAIGAVVIVAGGAWWLAKNDSPGAPPERATPTPSAAPVVAPVAAVDAGSGKESVVCRLTSSARPIVENVLQPAGLELAVSGSRIAVGFAKSEREAAAVELDTASLATKETVTSKSAGDISRVVPRFEADKLVALPESANMTKGVSVQRRAGDVMLGVAKSKLVRVPSEGAPEELFTLPSASVDALRVAQLPGSKTDAAYTYRAPGSVWLGTTQKGDSPQRIPGLGPQVGSPSVVALDAKNLIAVWADRAVETEPWGLRVAAYSPGKGNFTPKKFAPKGPAGAMLSPALVRVDSTHALLLWTLEKAKAGDPDTKTYEVLAQTLDAKGAPVGDSFAVSAEDMSGGQPQGVMDDHGKGTVAFLVSHGDVYDLAVAGIDCGK